MVIMSLPRSWGVLVRRERGKCLGSWQQLASLSCGQRLHLQAEEFWPPVLFCVNQLCDRQRAQIEYNNSRNQCTNRRRLFCYYCQPDGRCFVFVIRGIGSCWGVGVEEYSSLSIVHGIFFYILPLKKTRARDAVLNTGSWDAVKWTSRFVYYCTRSDQDFQYRLNHLFRCDFLLKLLKKLYNVT